MGIMAPQRRGIFGAHMRTDMAPTAGEPVPAMAQPMAQPQKGKVNWVGVLADALSGLAGGPANFANRQFERGQLQDARQYAEQTYQRRRGDTLTDQRSLLEYKRANPDPDYFDDNAGNRWTVNPTTGERKLVFRDPNQKMIPQKVTGPNGEEYIEYVKIPNMVNEDGTFQGASGGPTVGAVEDGYRFKGGDPADPNSWEEAGGGVPPISSAPARPNTVSRSAYQAWVNERGQAEADALLRRNGLRVGNY